MSKEQSLTNKGVDELHTLVNDLSDRVRTIRFGGAGSRTRNTKETRTARKTIARALTELRSQHKNLAKEA